MPKAFKKPGLSGSLYLKKCPLAGPTQSVPAILKLTNKKIDLALSDKRLFQDGEPTWEEAPTSRDSHEKCLSDIARLRRFADEFPDAPLLADRLEACDEDCRCMSNACSDCKRAFQRWAVSQIVELSKTEDRSVVRLYQITIVPVEAQVPLGRLKSADIPAFFKDCRRAIRKSRAVKWGFMTLDVSFNEETAKGYGEYWQPHMHGIIAVTNAKVLKSALRKAFPSCGRVYFPWKLQAYDKTKYGASYVVKTDAYRRSSYLHVSETRSYWKPGKPTRLRAHQHVEFLLASHAVGFSGKVLTHRIIPVCCKRQLMLKPVGWSQ